MRKSSLVKAIETDLDVEIHIQETSPWYACDKRLTARKTQTEQG